MSSPSDPAALEAEVARLTELLAAERAMFQAELVSGAAELARRDEVVSTLRTQRDRARARLQVYESSRLLRLTARAVRRVRRFRARA